MFSAEHPHGMGSEMKPVVIKIPSVEACMVKPIVKRQVLSLVSFFLSGFSHLSESTINKRCDWQLIRDSILAKINNKWWWKSERDVKEHEKKIFLLLFLVSSLFYPWVRNGISVYFTINFWKWFMSLFIKKLSRRALQRSSVVKGWLLALLNAGYSFKQSFSIMIE